MIEQLRYAYEELTTNYSDEYWWRMRVADRLVRPIHTRLYPRYTGSKRLMAADWDLLIVLDGCRADLFEQACDRHALDAYRRVTSLGSATPEWTESNFVGDSFGDTVYVSANPYTSMIAGNAFHELVEVWRDAFNNEERTVLPAAVCNAASDAAARHPKKRLVVHFMQPHYPFIGHPELRFAGIDTDRMRGRSATETDRGEPHDPWEALALGIVNRESVWAAYADNLNRVLEEALGFAQEFDGRAVITADHGNLLGERAWPVPIRLYGHPAGIRLPTLVRVPWAVLDGERRQVVDDGTNPARSIDQAVVKDRLRDLGYRE